VDDTFIIWPQTQMAKGFPWPPQQCTPEHSDHCEDGKRQPPSLPWHRYLEDSQWLSGPYLLILTFPHHHPINKHAILSILVHRARNLCDQDRLHADLVFLGDIFRQICRALNPLPRVAQCDKKPGSVAFLPSLVDIQLHQQGAVST
jgi:hypothetical protein